MQVNQLAQNPYIVQTHAPGGVEQAPSPQATGAANTDKVSISVQGKQLQESWQSLADGYDVRNISQREMSALSDALYQGGFIGRGEHLVLGAPRSMQADPNTKHDMLGEMQQSFGRFAQGMTTQAKQNYQGAIDILQNLAGSRHG